MSKHTPAPWIMEPDPGQPCPECGAEIGEAWMVGWKEEGRNKTVGIAVVLADQCEVANARLIAAAPDMLLACRAILAGWGHHDGVSKAVQLARAAVAKAEGK